MAIFRSDVTLDKPSIPTSFTACYVWDSVVLAFVTASRRTTLLLLHPTLQVENMAPVATTLTPNKESFDNSMTDRAASRRSSTTLTPPGSSRL